MTNLIFIHGVNAQTTGYSNTLFRLILNEYKAGLARKGFNRRQVTERTRDLVQREILWAQRTTDMTNRYSTLQYGLTKRPGKWNWILQGVDPLVIQIVHYVKDKGHHQGPMDLLRTIHTAFRQACANRPKRIVVIAHSLGSVISFDYLFGFRKYKINPRIPVTGFITMGSPIPLFTSAMGFADSKIPLPQNLKTWVNILDPDDGVARYCHQYFKGFQVEDLEINTGWDPLGSHGGYWKSQNVARAVAERLLAWDI